LLRDETVLVTDAEYISALGVVRSLGRRGHRVVCVSPHRRAHSFYSKYCSVREVVPDPAARPKEYGQALARIASREEVRVIFPVYIHSVRLLARRGRDLFTNVAMLVPPADSFEVADDKARTCAHAAGLRMPTPGYTLYREPGEVEAGIASGRLELPLVLKTPVGEGARGVRYLDRASDLQRLWDEIDPAKKGLLAQRRIRGDGYGVSLLFDSHSNCLARFVHRRLRESPPSGGASVLRESVDWPGLAEMAERLLASLHWRGVAMVEYKVAADGTPYLMEINPRFWGSLHLAVVSGVDFPYLYFISAIGRDPAPVYQYRAGIRASRLLYGGLQVLPHYIKASGSPMRALRETFGLTGVETHFDILSRDDPRPAWGRTLYTLSLLRSRR